MKVNDVAQSIADDCIGYRVRMLNRVVSRVYDDRLRPHGLRFSQMNILTLIVLRGPVQPAEVGRTLAIEKSTLSRNVRLMEENGWVSTEQAEGGGQLLSLTQLGEQVYRAAAPAWREAQDKVVASLGGQAARAIRSAAENLRGLEADE